MNMEKIEEKLDQNTSDIGKLAVNMATLTEIVKNTEQRHVEGMAAVQGVMVGIQKLLEKDIDALKSDCQESKSEIKVLNSRVSTIETWKDKATGGFDTAKAMVIIFWAVFGTGFIGVGAWVLSMIFGGGHGGGEINITN